MFWFVCAAEMVLACCTAEPLTSSAALASAAGVLETVSVPFSPVGAESCRFMGGRSPSGEILLIPPAPPRPVPALNRGALEESEYSVEPLKLLALEGPAGDKDDP